MGPFEGVELAPATLDAASAAAGPIKIYFPIVRLAPAFGC
jgi:hypothetical protein